MLSPEDKELGRTLYKKALNISKQPEKYDKPLFISGDGESLQTLTLPNYVHYMSEN